MRSALPLLSAAVVCTIGVNPEQAWAYEFRARWVHRQGNTDTVIDDSLDVSSGATYRLRLQFGVFDDAVSAAPAGGFLGWNLGTLTVSGSESNSYDTRTPGRLAPFTFTPHPSSNGDPPLPGGDPFTILTAIDATLGPHSLNWNCGPDGVPLPQPNPTIRGRNTFVSVYEITTDPIPGVLPYTITAAGNLYAATEWRVVGTPIPPDCGDPGDPGDDVPGAIFYAPLPTRPVAFSATVDLIIPGPAGVVVLAVGGMLPPRRRR